MDISPPIHSNITQRRKNPKVIKHVEDPLDVVDMDISPPPFVSRKRKLSEQKINKVIESNLDVNDKMDIMLNSNLS